MRKFLPIFSLIVLCAALAAAEKAVFDSHGRMTSILDDGRELGVRTNLGAPLAGWIKLPGIERSDRTEVTRSGDATTWTGEIEAVEGQTARFRQTVTERDGRTHIAIKVEADAGLDAEGVYFWIDLPRDSFIGGKAETGEGAGADMPQRKPPLRDFLRCEAKLLRLTDASGSLRLEAELDRPRPVLLRDRWTSEGRFYTAFIELHRGALARGGKAALELSLSLQGRAETRPAILRMDPARSRYAFHGFGGNYCFEIESPVTQYTLNNLRVAWARTEMTLSEWEPVNDNESPDEVNWEALERQDAPDSNLRREFLLARQIQAMGIPYAIAIWHIPEWMYEDPGKNPGTLRRRLAQGRWDELRESVGSYLLYAKRRYGVEPDLFSFNEPNLGVYVLFSPEEHRDAIKSFGAYFQKLGLKTKWLLADTTDPRGTHAYGLPAANDPEALRHVGAVSFHSWGGGSTEQYKAWGDLAEWLDLPFLVGEFGVDAFAWRGEMYDSFHYGLREVRMLQELLLHARPQAALLWEFTADYGIVQTRPKPTGGEELVPTHRFWFVKHFADLTPNNSNALETNSNESDVLLTAFAGEQQGRRVYTLHVANMGPAREAVIHGLPADAGPFRMVWTSEADQFRELEQVRASDGVLRLALPARCLVTLASAP